MRDGPSYGVPDYNDCDSATNPNPIFGRDDRVLWDGTPVTPGSAYYCTYLYPCDPGEGRCAKNWECVSGSCGAYGICD